MPEERELGHDLARTRALPKMHSSRGENLRKRGGELSFQISSSMTEGEGYPEKGGKRPDW
jgi:hypothetical protein